MSVVVLRGCDYDQRFGLDNPQQILKFGDTYMNPKTVLSGSVKVYFVLFPEMQKSVLGFLAMIHMFSSSK